MKSESCWKLYNTQLKNSIMVLCGLLKYVWMGGRIKAYTDLLWHFLSTSIWAVSHFKLLQIGAGNGGKKVVSKKGEMQTKSGRTKC